VSVTNNPSDPSTTPSSVLTSEGNDTVAGNDTVTGNTVLTEGDPAAPELFDPEKFEFPTDLNREHETFKQFTGYAKEAGLSKDAAGKLIGIHAAAVKATSEAIYKTWTDQQATWVGEIKADPELNNTSEVRKTVAALLDNTSLSDPKFREALDTTGAGNNPAVVRTLYRWAKALSEGASRAGDPVPRDAQGQPIKAAPATAGAAIYGPQGPHSGGPKLS
jgi:hypothetical protein